MRQLGHGGHVARVLLNRADQRILHLGQQLQLGKRERVERRRGGPPRAPARVARGTAATSLDSDRKSTRLNSSHPSISYAVFCLKKKKKRPEYRQHNLY